MLNTLEYRHVAVALRRDKVGEQFSRGYTDETTEVEELELGEDDPLGMEERRGRGEPLRRIAGCHQPSSLVLSCETRRVFGVIVEFRSRICRN
jgi:hypothetical protein